MIALHIFLAFALLPLVIAALVARTKSYPADWTIVLALFVCAVAVRWSFGLHSYIHENMHSYHRSYGPCPLETISLFDVPSSQIVLATLAHAIVPTGEDGLFGMNILFSSLSVMGLYCLARLALPWRLAAWSSACLLVFQPLAVYLAPTEEYLVTATGLVLVGSALLFWGVSERRVIPELVGTAWICLAASAREITLPLSLLIVIIIAAARSRQRPFSRDLALMGFAAVTLLPRCIAHVMRIQQESELPPFVGLTSIIFRFSGAGVEKAIWTGWLSPFVPEWMAWLALVSLLSLTVAALWPQHRKAALVAVGSWIVVQGAGSLVINGHFTSLLRHQVGAMAFMLLAPGWVIGWLTERCTAVVPPRHRQALISAIWVSIPTLGLLTLYTTGISPGNEIPAVKEYTFFRDFLRDAPRNARLIILEEPNLGVTHLTRQWIANWRPDFTFVSADQARNLSVQADGVPTYLFLDRPCFIDRPKELPFAPQVEVVPSDYGRISPICADVLAALPWEEVRRQELRFPTDDRFLRYDLRSLDPTIDLAILGWKGP